VIVCGVDLKSNEARLCIVTVKSDEPTAISCKTKKITLADDKDCKSVNAFFQAVKSFATENKIDTFSIKSRAKNGLMAGGAISFKMEAIFQLSGSEVSFVNAVALSKFAKTNLGGIPSGILKYQEDAYLCGAYILKDKKKI
jgi:hypothetical protein